MLRRLAVYIAFHVFGYARLTKQFNLSEHLLSKFLSRLFEDVLYLRFTHPYKCALPVLLINL